MLTADTSIKFIKGVGEKRAQLFAKLGITDIKSLLTHYPRGYQNRGNTIRLCAAEDGELSSFILKITSPITNSTSRNGMLLTRFTAADRTGICSVIYFNNRFASQTFVTGQICRFFGRVQYQNGIPTLLSPVHELIPDGATPSSLIPIVPVYPLCAGLTQQVIFRTIKSVLDSGDEVFPALLPKHVSDEEKLCDAEFAFRNIHFPKTEADLSRARDYFAFAELYAFGRQVALAKKHIRSGNARSTFVTDKTMERFYSALPYTLTDCQQKAVDEIRADMADVHPMNRMLMGDVGSGKTVVAAAAAFIAAANGGTALLMAPTEILARQHYADLSPLFEKLGYKTVLLVGSQKPKERAASLSAIENGEVSLVVGTHALISEGVKFNNVLVTITDEQHRFGVEQREKLTQKGQSTLYGMEIKCDSLVMSATPIPRTLALALYGDLDQSTLDKLPPGRQKIDTFSVDSTYITRLDAFIKKQIAGGNRVYIVCPAIDKKDAQEKAGITADAESDYQLTLDDLFGEDNEKLPVANATEEFERLTSLYPNMRVGLVHGKQKGAERDKTMTEFAEGNLDVLVSTTVIEVGVNVPSATLMIIRNAERFGLSQLHQLRGRVGRGKDKSYCVLVSDSKGENAKSRLGAMCATANGFEIAQKDLELRGPGDFIADAADSTIRQSGELSFCFAGYAINDTELLKRAFGAAERDVAKL